MSAPDLITQAHTLLDLQEAEGRARNAYNAATQYYHWGHYKADGIPVDDLQPLFENLRKAWDVANFRKVDCQVQFEDRITQREPDKHKALTLRESLLMTVRQQRVLLPREKQLNAFEQWLQERGVELEPDLSGPPESKRSRRRERGR